MSDIALKYVGQIADFQMVSGDLGTDDGLGTSILVSLFTDKRAEASEVESGVVDEFGGWWGSLLINNSGFGSRIWFTRRSKLTGRTLDSLGHYAEEALQWILTEKLARKIVVSTQRLNATVAVLRVDLYRPGATAPNRYEFETFWSANGSA